MMPIEDTWQLVYDAFAPEKESLREALCTLGNGYFATRGAAPEAQADEVHYPATYFAGGYNRLKTEMAGRVIENEDLVNFPNWLSLTFRIEGCEWFHLKAVEILSYCQILHLKQGVLERTIRFRDAHGRETTLSDKRLVHMKNLHLAALERTLVAENWSGQIEICSALDGRVKNAGVKRYRALNNTHLDPLERGNTNSNIIYLKVQTNQSELRLAQAAKTKLFLEGEEVQAHVSQHTTQEHVAQHFALHLSQGKRLTTEKIVALYTSRDHAISECCLEAKEAVIQAPSFSELLRTHSHIWDSLWRRCHIDIEKKSLKQKKRHSLMILRLHLFHLLQTASHNTIELDVGVPARGWHGEAYRGHIFWDELFIFPIFNLRMPEITRAFLKYRYRRLDRAREAALKADFRGAMYPWQSGSNGREESQEVHLNPKSGRWIPDNSSIQRHVNAAIAYNIWQYYQETGDVDFLQSHGAEMILEIARFWASLTTYNEKLGRYEILSVMGPDEYHDSYPETETPGLNNNAYTNVMAVWVLCCALETLNLLPDDRRQDLCQLLDITQAEIEQWDNISRKMRLVFHGEGIISQFEGYEKLEEFPWEKYHRKYGDIQRLDRILEAENDTPNRYKVSKQADVLMLFYLFSSEKLKELFERLGYSFEHETIPKNIDYYIKRTSHGSTLSRIVHAWVLTRANRPGSWELFDLALESDVADIQGGTTPEGIHLGAMAGTVDLIQRCYTGIETREDVLWFNPCLPEAIHSLNLCLHYRQHSLEVTLTREKLTIATHPSAAKPIRIGFKSEVHTLSSGKSKTFKIAD